jgi:hypothetical protein
MCNSMDRYVEVVKQYPGQEQVDLAIEIEVAGSWFSDGPMGALTATERREKYTAQAVEYSEVREFPGASRASRKTKEKAWKNKRKETGKRLIPARYRACSRFSAASSLSSWSCVSRLMVCPTNTPCSR